MSNSTHTRPDPVWVSSATTSFIQIAALAILVVFCFRIIEPFVGIVLWSIVLAVAIYPVHTWLRGKLGGRNKLSATLIVLLGLAVLLVPVSMMTDSTVSAAKTLGADLKDGSFTIPPPSDRVKNWPLIGEHAHTAWMQASTDTKETLNQFRPQLVALSEKVLKGIGSAAAGILAFVASLIIMGVFLATGESGYKASKLLMGAVAGDRGDHMTDLSVATIRSVAKGVLGVAVIQTLLSAIGLFAIGIPGAGIWTAVILLLAVMQIPTLIVMGPLALWAFSFAEPVPATIFAIYAVLVSLSDNFLKPLLLGRGLDIPMLVVLLGAIGGAIYAGIIGLFLGAAILALGYTLAAEWVTPDNIYDAGQKQESAETA